MITEADIFKDIPRLYMFLLKKDLLGAYLLGLNEPQLHRSMPIEDRWKVIKTSKSEALNICFSWSRYNSIFPKVEWGGHSYEYSCNYSKLPYPSANFLKKLKLI